VTLVWTPEQVTAALDLLEHAKTSWTGFIDAKPARQRVRKRTDRNAHHPGMNQLLLAWSAEYFQAERAEVWGVAGLGDCERCDHAFVHHHGGRACLECVVANVEWSERCREPLPSVPAS
jgi:hypothetical protein